MKSFLLGKKIYMRGLHPEELLPGTPYFSWMNDLSLDLFTERTYFPTTPEKMQAYYENAQRHTDTLLLGIFDNETEKHIGNITFTQINMFHRRAFIAYLIGDRSFSGRGIATDANLMLMYYGFNKLNFERIDGGVSNAHAASIRVCEKVGLLTEGKRRNHFYRGGTWYDSILVGAIRDEWMKTHGEAAKECFAELPAI